MCKLYRKLYYQQIYKRSQREAKMCSMQRKSQGKINTLCSKMQVEKNSYNHLQYHFSSILVLTITISLIHLHNIINSTTHYYTGNQLELNINKV